jgi:MFS family permease
LYQVGYALAVLLILPLTDRVRTGVIIAAGSALSAVAFVPFGLVAHDVWSASALRVPAGAGLAAIYLPGVRVVAAAAESARRGLAVSVYVSAFYIGASAGFPVAIVARAAVPNTSSGHSWELYVSRGWLAADSGIYSAAVTEYAPDVTSGPPRRRRRSSASWPPRSHRWRWERFSTWAVVSEALLIPRRGRG